MFDPKSYLLRPLEPTDYVVSDVVLENFWADDIFTAAFVRNGQQCSGTPALIRDALGAVRNGNLGNSGCTGTGLRLTREGHAPADYQRCSVRTHWGCCNLPVRKMLCGH